MQLALLAATLLSQAPTQSAPSDLETAQRAAAAAERSAAAAERAAAAMEALAQKLTSPPDVPAKEVPAGTPAPAPSPWSGSIGLNLISMSGNSETLTFSVLGAASRELGSWKLGLKVSGAYGQTRVASLSEAKVVALNAGGQLRLERKLASIASAFLMAGADTDHVKSLEYRVLGEGGAAIVWLEKKQGDEVLLLLRTDLGMRYANEVRYQYYPTPAQLPNVTLVAPKLGLGFRYALNKNISFVEEAEVLTNLVGPSRVLVTSTSKLSARLTDSLALNVGFQVNHDGAPPAGKKPTDTILSAGVELAF